MIFLRCRPECYSCLEKLAERTARGAGGDRQALKAGLAFLEANFDYRRIPTILAGEIQRVIRKEAKNPDPFAAIKEKEMPLGRMLAEKYALPREASLEEAVAFAAKGNSLDFFLELDLMEKEMAKPVEFVRNDVPQLLSLLKGEGEREKTIIFCADNAGECYFDLPLYRKLSRWGKVYYAAKDSPVQNDLTVADLGRSGIAHLFDRVVSTGSDTPGLDPALCSPRFLELLKEADLVVAKGMGNYETIPEMSLQVPVFLILKAKCQPVASDLGVPLNSYVAVLMKP